MNKNDFELIRKLITLHDRIKQLCKMVDVDATDFNVCITAAERLTELASKQEGNRLEKWIKNDD